jgi:hypothetical protein
MHAVPPPKAVSAPRTPAEVRTAAAVLWNGGTRYRVTDPTSGRSVRLDVASDGVRTRLRLQTPRLVIWLGGSSKTPKPTFVCVQIPPGRPSCDPPAPTKTTAQEAILVATRPLLQYAQLIAPGALTGEQVRVTTEAGFPVGCLQGQSRAGLGHVRLCTTRDGLLTEVDYKGVRIQAVSVKTAITSSDLAPPA